MAKRTIKLIRKDGKKLGASLRFQGQKSFTVGEIIDLIKDIDFSSQFNRPYNEDNRPWQSALISAICSSHDENTGIPDIYLQEKDIQSRRPGEKKYISIDGQHRLRSIIDFYENKFKIIGQTWIRMVDADGEESNIPVVGKFYSEMDSECQEAFLNKILTFKIVKGDEIDIADLFRRLNDGIEMTSQEKRNALPGPVSEYVRNVVKHHPIFRKRTIEIPVTGRELDEFAAKLYFYAIHIDKNTAWSISSVGLDTMYINGYNADKGRGLDTKSINHINHILNEMESCFEFGDGDLMDEHRKSFAFLFNLFMVLYDIYYDTYHNKEVTIDYPRFTQQFSRIHVTSNVSITLSTGGNRPSIYKSDMKSSDKECLERRVKYFKYDFKTQRDNYETEMQELFDKALKTKPAGYIDSPYVHVTAKDENRTVSDDVVLAKWEEQDHKCFYCEKKIAQSHAIKGHSNLAHSFGGNSDEENTVAECSSCNSLQASMGTEEFLKTLEKRKINNLKKMKK